ncbi:basic membrane protein A [Ruminococcaceae bacterium YRB3002]|nr:basic membrane protein A [Ruminococcaceae bacterium YRB3002]
MKKVISLIITAAIMAVSLFTFAGCGAKDGDNGQGDFIVGAIYINSQNDTSGYTYAHHKGLVKAMQDLGLDTTRHLKIVDNVEEDDMAVSNAIDLLAGQGCDIIFGISFGYINAMKEKSEEFSDIVFSHATGYMSNDTNFNNYFGRIYQARYLSGIAAGFKSLALGNNNIGYVSAWGTEYAETCSGINAFALGARSVNPDAVIHVKKISAWGDQEKERQAAEVLIDTYDCCVIGQHCDSAQPQLVAQEKGMFGCGYNSDMTSQAPNAHLTAPIWNWDVYYRYAIETAMNNPASQFVSTVGNYYGGLVEGMVDLTPLSANCEPGTDEAIRLAREAMVTGTWDVFSGSKLVFTVRGGNVEMSIVGDALLDNAGNEIVPAGGPSVDDGVIQGSMNYYLEGVIAE